MEEHAQIFKKDEADDIFIGVQSFNFETLEARAREIIANAQAQAEAQIQRAAAEVDKIRDDIRGQEFEAARKEGYDKGYAEGAAKGEAEGKEQAYSQVYVELKKAVDSTPEVLKKVIDEVESHRKILTEEAEKDLLSLAFAIGERIARVKIESDPKVVQKTLREAVDLVLNRHTLDVFICPDDADAIDEYLPQVRKMYSDIETLRVHPDKRIERGSCEVHTARGKVSIHVDELIDSIANYLLGMAPGQVLERIMEQFDISGDDDLPGAAGDRNSDEIDLAAALEGDFDEEAEIKRAETQVFMQDSILEGVAPVEEEEEDDEKAPESGAMTRVFTSDIFAPAEEEIEEPSTEDAFEAALGETSEEAAPAVHDVAIDTAAPEETDAGDDLLGGIMDAPVEASADDMLAEAAAPAEEADAGDDLLGGIMDAPVEASAEASADDMLAEAAPPAEEADDLLGGIMDAPVEASAEAAADDMLAEAAAPAEEVQAESPSGDVPDLDAALAELGDLRGEAKMDPGAGSAADDLINSIDTGPAPEGDALGGEGGGDDLENALAELGSLRDDAKMDGGSLLGEDLFGDEPEEEEKPFMQDSFLEDLFEN